MQDRVSARRHAGAAVVVATVLAGMLATHAAAAQDAPRFAGPLMSPAPPLPVGMLNIEPYLIHSRLRGVYDGKGHHRNADAPGGWHLSVPVQYGVHERVTLAATFNAMYDRDDGESRAFDVGDTSLSALVGLFNGGGSARPTLTLALRQSLATGHHDRLEDRSISVATGNGVRATSVGLHGQAYFLDDHLRMRASSAWRIPGSSTGVRGRSAYGTPDGFDGQVRVGAALASLLAAEYSLSRSWVLAGELLHERESAGSVHGTRPGDGGRVEFHRRDPASWRFSVVPAVQYHWNDNLALVAGVQVSVAGRNSSQVVAPQLALNMVF